MRFDNPFVLITRPRPAALSFGDALQEACPRPFRPIIAPVFDYERGSDAPTDAWGEAIFTSAQAVEMAEPGAGRRAWCVGDATARAAQAQGYDTESAAGTADDLVALILSGRPAAQLLHIRGEVSRGDVAGRLRAAGLRCDEWIAYRKRPLALPDEALDILNGEAPVLLPLFSAETVSILAGYGPFRAPLHVQAISGAVVEAARALRPKTVEQAPRPDQGALVALVAALIA